MAGVIAFAGAIVAVGVLVTLGLLLTKFLLRARAGTLLRGSSMKWLFSIVLVAALLVSFPLPWMGAARGPMWLVFILLAYYIGMALYVIWKRSLAELELDPMLASLRSA
jgi:hypothetical protein